MKICTKCKRSDRYPSGHCKYCRKQYDKRWRSNNTNLNKLCLICTTSSRNKDGTCKYCRNQYKKQWRLNSNKYRPCVKCNVFNRTKNGECKRCRMKCDLVYKYNLTIEQFDQLLINSCGRCMVCNDQFKNCKDDPVVDHDHKTDKVRGLLCYNCNLFIDGFGCGMIVGILESAINYINHSVTNYRYGRRRGVKNNLIYDNLLMLSHGRCAICNNQFKNIINEPCVDHNHKTKMIRGLLCSKCNLSIGGFNDNVSILKQAIIYIEGGQ
jgi:hypothetical protein